MHLPDFVSYFRSFTARRSSALLPGLSRSSVPGAAQTTGEPPGPAERCHGAEALPPAPVF